MARGETRRAAKVAFVGNHGSCTGAAEVVTLTRWRLSQPAASSPSLAALLEKRVSRKAHNFSPLFVARPEAAFRPVDVPVSTGSFRMTLNADADNRDSEAVEWLDFRKK